MYRKACMIIDILAFLKGNTYSLVTLTVGVSSVRTETTALSNFSIK